MASEQTTMPEPADGHGLYWPAVNTGEFPVVMVRDDRLGKEWEWTDDRRVRWFEPNTAGEPMTWAEMCEHSAQEGYPLSESVHLEPAPERIGDHLREPAGYCRSCGTEHAPTEWARLRQREAAR